MPQLRGAEVVRILGDPKRRRASLVVAAEAVVEHRLQPSRAPRARFPHLAASRPDGFRRSERSPRARGRAARRVPPRRTASGCCPLPRSPPGSHRRATPPSSARPRRDARRRAGSTRAEARRARRSPGRSARGASEIASQRASSHRWTDETVASHFQRSCSLTGMSPASNPLCARRRIGTAAS